MRPMDDVAADMLEEFIEDVRQYDAGCGNARLG